MYEIEHKAAGSDHSKILLAYTKHFGNTGWYVERALMRLPSVYALSVDLRSYRSNVIGFLKGKFGTYRQRRSAFANEMARVATRALVRMGFTSEASHVVDIEPILSKIGDVDVLIHVDGAGTPVVKNVEKAGQSVLWALDTHIKAGYLLRIASSYDYVFVAQKRDLNRFRRVNPKSYWLPYAADPTVHKPYDSANSIFDIVFVGSLIPGLHDERAKLIRMLERNFNLKVFEQVWLDQMAKTYSSSRVILNRSVNGDLNMRVFEALSCGRLLMTDMANGILDLFEDRKHLVIYDESNVNEIIQHYLKNVEERNEIAENGRREVWQKHTYDLRLGEILEKIE